MISIRSYASVSPSCCRGMGGMLSKAFLHPQCVCPCPSRPATPPPWTSLYQQPRPRAQAPVSPPHPSWAANGIPRHQPQRHSVVLRPLNSARLCPEKRLCWGRGRCPGHRGLPRGGRGGHPSCQGAPRPLGLLLLACRHCSLVPVIGDLFLSCDFWLFVPAQQGSWVPVSTPGPLHPMALLKDPAWSLPESPCRL